MNLFFVFVSLCSWISAILANPAHVPLLGKEGGKRTMVMLEDSTDTAKFSTFFDDLKMRGHILSVFTPESEDLEIKKYGDSLFDNILLLSPKLEKFRTITFEDLAEFVEEGGNILLAAGKEASNELRDFAENFGVTFDKRGSELIDHFSTEPILDKTLQHTTVVVSNAVDSKPVLGSFNKKISEKPVLYKGIAHTVAEDNILAVPILKGNPTSYSFFPNKPMNDGPFSAGGESLLVTGIQGRNNARVVIAGSIDMFTNIYMGMPPSNAAFSKYGNRDFVENVSKWVFCEQGVLRFRDIVHHTADGTPPDVILHEKARPDLPVTLYPDPEIARNALVYRIKDQIVYSMIVEEYRDGHWKPFVANDMQMEFVMLDPYVRKTMTCEASTGKFIANFTAPDNYGVFKFRVLYRRRGYSVIHAETQVSLRPFKHNEYERFIYAAYPYYFSAFSAVVALFFFSIFFLFSSDK